MAVLSRTPASRSRILASDSAAGISADKQHQEELPISIELFVEPTVRL
jgi:hypothetical protein